MGLIPDDTISEIRARADIVAVIGKHVELRKAGRNHKGLCPFHQEKTPSFNVNGEKGFYYCFGCQQKGDVFSFLMEYEGKSFLEAAETLAALAGVTIPETGTDPAHARQARTEKSEMLRLCGLAAQFYRHALDSDAGAPARAYLAGRGIGDEMAAAFRLGYAPADWRALADFFAKKRAPLALAEKIGLVLRQPRAGGLYDRFRDRLMCPVFDASGEVVGFSGRRLAEGAEADKAGAKYINSSESPIYKKSKLLYGLSQAREAFRATGSALLVEGNFDVISLHQAGFRQAVAPLGTALTDEQAAQLRRLVGKVVLLYDGDRAGRAATIKALKTLLAADVDVHIATLPAGSDPDSLVADGGPEALARVLGRTQPAVEYFIHEVWASAGESAHGRAEALAEAAQVLRTISDPTGRDFAVGTLARALGTDEPTLRRGLRRALSGGTQPAERHPAPQAAPMAPPDELELKLIGLLAEYPELLATAEELKVSSYLTDSRLRDMYSAALEGRPLFTATSDPSIARHVFDGAYASLPDPEATLRGSVETLSQIRKRARIAELQRQAEAARRRGDHDLARKLSSEIIATRKQVD